MTFTVFDPTQTPTASIGYQNVNNLLINGGFEFWQRNSTFTNPANATYTADRWKVDTNAPSIAVVTQETSVIETGAGSSSYKVVISGSPSSKNWAVFNRMERVAQLQGRTVSFSARVKCSVTNAIRVIINDGVSQTKSSYHSGSGNWETLSVTKTLDPAASLCNFEVGMYDNGDAQNGTYYFGSAMAVIGSTAVSFVPKVWADELMECQHFYEKSYDIATVPGTNTLVNINPGSGAQTGASQVEYDFVVFKVSKRVIPTIVTYDGTGTSGNARTTSTSGTGTNRAVTTENIGTNGFSYFQGAALDYRSLVHFTADAEI